MLDRHIRDQHLTPNSKIHHCQGCTAKFRLQQHLHEHVKKVHIEKKWKCPSCTGLFKTKGVLKRHINTMHQIAEYKCKFCDMPFTTRVNVEVQVFTYYKLIMKCFKMHYHLSTCRTKNTQWIVYQLFEIGGKCQCVSGDHSICSASHQFSPERHFG